MSQKTKKLILIDSNALMHRAYHALPPLTTKKGEVVNAVYGFTSVLLKVIKDLEPDYMICAFDVAGGTFRDGIYKDYKAGRKKPDQEFYDQIPKIKEVIKAFNISIIEKKGFEADDVIGSVSKQINSISKGEKDTEKIEIIIVTGDLDVLQLVDKNTKIYTLKKGIKDTAIYDEKAIKERYELKPEQIVDFKGLCGDPSDNIPGVAGIGEKGAIDLLKNFGSIENLYEALDKNKTNDLIRPRIKEKLIAQRNEAFMSKELATIKCDMNLKLDLKEFVWGNYDRTELNNLFREFEFYSLMGRVDKANRNGDSVSEMETKPPFHRDKNSKYVKYIILDNEKKIDKFLEELKKQKRFIFQTRNNDDNVAEKDLTGLVFLWSGSPIYYVPIMLSSNKPNLFNVSDLKKDSFLEKLKPILEDNNYKKMGYFFKRDIETLSNHGVDAKGLDFDIMIAAYLLDPGKRDYSKDKIIFDYLGQKNSEKIENEEKIKEKIKHANEIAKLSHLPELYEILRKNLKKTEMEDLFYKIEMPLIKVLVKMEMRGIKIDSKLLEILSHDIEEKTVKLANKIHKFAGNSNFNINSSQQLSHILFNKMKLPTEDIKKTQTGYSVAATELEKLKDKHIIINFISEYKELTKLKNTYADALPKLVSRKTEKLHTTFHQIVTATGRLSSSNPNLQNIPIRTEFGRKIRRAFVSDFGRKLLSVDYSQIELRIIAMIANDKKMKKIFSDGLDIHAATAAEINQVPINDITPEMRRAAKALNFGIIYGMSVFGFSQSAGIDRKRAKKFIDSYMKKFSAVAKYIEKSKDDARKKGYAQTLWGRRRYLPELNSSNVMVKNSAERMAINMPIQGTAADIIKIAMLKIDKWIAEYNDKNEDAVRMLIQVHDELVFSVKEENIAETAKNIIEIMENRHVNINGKSVDFTVPIKVDVKVGESWEGMKELSLTE